MHQSFCNLIYSQSSAFVLVCNDVCSPASDRHKQRDRRAHSIRCNISSSPLHLPASYFLPIVSPFLSLLSALPFFANQNIFTQSSPPPPWQIQEADWQFQRRNHLSGGEAMRPISQKPCRHHGNTQQEGREPRERRYDHMQTLHLDLIYDSHFIATLQFRFVV